MTQGGVSKLETLAAENIRGINIETSEKVMEVMEVTENTTPWRKREEIDHKEGKLECRTHWTVEGEEEKQEQTCEKERGQNWKKEHTREGQ